MKCINLILFTGMLAFLLAGCASQKTAKTVHERGWIGGHYALVKGKPARVQITGLSCDTPAATAGLCPGDFVLKLNHQPVTSLSAFQRTIDGGAPGSLLTLTAYHDGQVAEYKVPVGREKYVKAGSFTMYVPTVVHSWSFFWPTPGFSLVFAGYLENPEQRNELGKAQEVYDENWTAFLGIAEFSHGAKVIAQEPVATTQ